MHIEAVGLLQLFFGEVGAGSMQPIQVLIKNIDAAENIFHVVQLFSHYALLLVTRVDFVVLFSMA